MTSHLLDGHNLAEFEDITRQSLGDPHIRVEKIELFDGNLLTVGTNDLPVMAEYPDPCLPKIQISDPPSLLAVNPSGLLSTDMADRLESFVGCRLQVSLLGIAGHPLSENTDSRKGEIVCYTH
jgi:hypothetical protein